MKNKESNDLICHIRVRKISIAMTQHCKDIVEKIEFVMSGMEEGLSETIGGIAKMVGLINLD